MGERAKEDLTPPKAFSRVAESLIGDLRRIPSGDPPKMRRRATRELAALIEDAMVKYQIGRNSPEQTLREHWPKIVGEANAAYSHPLCIDEKGRLVVLTSHGVVRSELFLHREAVVERIRKLPGCGDIRYLHVRAGV